MTAYERVRYRTETGTGRTIILRDPQEIGTLGRCLTGIEVDREGDEVASRGADERRHLISLDLVTRRTPLHMDNLTGLLEPSET